jgi:hypothetical protein
MIALTIYHELAFQVEEIILIFLRESVVGREAPMLPRLEQPRGDTMVIQRLSERRTNNSCAECELTIMVVAQNSLFFVH